MTSTEDARESIKPRFLAGGAGRVKRRKLSFQFCFVIIVVVVVVVVVKVEVVVIYWLKCPGPSTTYIPSSVSSTGWPTEARNWSMVLSSGPCSYPGLQSQLAVPVCSSAVIPACGPVLGLCRVQVPP